jgi:hypothetical protein
MDPAILKLAREMVMNEGKPLRGHPCGHFINSRGEVKPIPGAISRYVDGKPVIDVPLKEVPAERRRRLIPVTIDNLCKADGCVDEAEAHDEPAYDPAVERVRSLMFDPEDTALDEEKDFESTDSEEETSEASEGESGVQETTVVE